MDYRYRTHVREPQPPRHFNPLDTLPNSTENSKEREISKKGPSIMRESSLRGRGFHLTLTSVVSAMSLARVVLGNPGEGAVNTTKKQEMKGCQLTMPLKGFDEGV